MIDNPLPESCILNPASHCPGRKANIGANNCWAIGDKCFHTEMAWERK